MARFIVKETQACYVTWDFIVEADDKEQALEKFFDGEHQGTEGEPFIGDCLDWLDTEQHVFPDDGNVPFGYPPAA